MSSLCPPCAAASMRWLDYSPPPVPVVLCSPGRTAREIRLSQERRYQDWRDTVRWQQEHIARLCAAGNHCEPKS
jgi:hypothetical protein